ncbi:MAG: hypothetical protein WBF06_09105 [Candidatus Acidiferrales bacterium]
MDCDTADINPFLLWLASAKTANYSRQEIEAAKNGAEQITVALRNRNGKTASWYPPLFNIEKWWDGPILERLGKIRSMIEDQATQLGPQATTLLKVSFCRVVIELANVSFGHQSMSFKKPQTQMVLQILTDATETVADKWLETTNSILQAAQTHIQTKPNCLPCDARSLTDTFARASFDCVITSPPYPNRMSYIRELRPYMYWLGYLYDARQAGELDWKAIGGTWGCATSNLNAWQAPESGIPFSEFGSILARISKSSGLLSRYVHKYFCDMAVHVRELFEVVKPGGTVHYIVGNSKFYDVLLPVEQIFTCLFEHAGFVDANYTVVRKRTSKKELFEYDVTATKPL